jgi:hypothetical protein
MHTNVYIDGFNLNYGCFKGTRFKWLDVAMLSSLSLPQNCQIHPLLHRADQTQKERSARSNSGNRYFVASRAAIRHGLMHGRLTGQDFQTILRHRRRCSMTSGSAIRRHSMR